MRNVVLLALLLLSASACGTPTAASSALRPLHHNIPATFVGSEGGPIIWLCATQPRFYEGALQEDHYLQYSPCPAEPIR